MNREKWNDFPQLQQVLHGLEDGERLAFSGIEGMKNKREEEIVKRLFPPNSDLGHAVNVIPGQIRGECRPILIVVIGWNYSSEKGLIQSLEKSVEQVRRCAGVTKHVIFYAQWWDFAIWSKRRGDFEKTKVKSILRPPFQEPLDLH